MEMRHEQSSLRVIKWTTAAVAAATLYYGISALRGGDKYVTATFVGLVLYLVTCWYLLMQYRTLRLVVDDEFLFYLSIYDSFALRFADVTRIEWVLDTGFKSRGGVDLITDGQHNVVPFSGFDWEDTLSFIEYVRSHLPHLPQSHFERVENLYTDLKIRKHAKLNFGKRAANDKPAQMPPPPADRAQ